MFISSGFVLRWMHCRENLKAEVGDATKCGKTARVAAGRREMQEELWRGGEAAFSP